MSNWSPDTLLLNKFAVVFGNVLQFNVFSCCYCYFQAYYYAPPLGALSDPSVCLSHGAAALGAQLP